MKWILTALVILAPMLTTAHALPNYAFCDSCGEAQYQATAIAFVPDDPDQPRYQIYVADVSKGELRRFRVIRVVEPGLDFEYAQRLDPSATELQRFEAFLAARNEVLQSLGMLDFTIEIPPGHFVGSAYDLWGSNHKQLLVREFINAELSIFEAAFSNLFAYGSFLLDRSASKLFIKVEFPDGSIALFELQGKREDLVWAYVRSESIDEDGNLIPDRLSDFSDYSGLFNAISVQSFLLRAALYGIPVVDRRDGDRRTAVVCVHSANGDYSCVATSTH